jgi:hypothetical protein
LGAGGVPVEEGQEYFRAEEEVGKGEEGGREDGMGAALMDEHQQFLQDHLGPNRFFSIVTPAISYHGITGS